jgi:thymidylate synthase ThyX
MRKTLSLLSLYQDMVLKHNNKVKKLNVLTIPKNTRQTFQVNINVRFFHHVTTLPMKQQYGHQCRVGTD